MSRIHTVAVKRSLATLEKEKQMKMVDKSQEDFSRNGTIPDVMGIEWCQHPQLKNGKVTPPSLENCPVTTAVHKKGSCNPAVDSCRWQMETLYPQWKACPPSSSLFQPWIDKANRRAQKKVNKHTGWQRMGPFCSSLAQPYRRCYTAIKASNDRTMPVTYTDQYATVRPDNLKSVSQDVIVVDSPEHVAHSNVSQTQPYRQPYTAMKTYRDRTMPVTYFGQYATAGQDNFESMSLSQEVIVGDQARQVSYSNLTQIQLKGNDEIHPFQIEKAGSSEKNTNSSPAVRKEDLHTPELRVNSDKTINTKQSSEPMSKSMIETTEIRNSKSPKNVLNLTSKEEKQSMLQKNLKYLSEIALRKMNTRNAEEDKKSVTGQKSDASSSCTPYKICHKPVYVSNSEVKMSGNSKSVLQSSTGSLDTNEKSVLKAISSSVNTSERCVKKVSFGEIQVREIETKEQQKDNMYQWLNNSVDDDQYLDSEKKVHETVSKKQRLFKNALDLKPVKRKDTYNKIKIQIKADILRKKLREPVQVKKQKENIGALKLRCLKSAVKSRACGNKASRSVNVDRKKARFQENSEPTTTKSISSTYQTGTQISDRVSTARTVGQLYYSSAEVPEICNACTDSLKARDRNCDVIYVTSCKTICTETYSMSRQTQGISAAVCDLSSLSSHNNVLNEEDPDLHFTEVDSVCTIGTQTEASPVLFAAASDEVSVTVVSDSVTADVRNYYEQCMEPLSMKVNKHKNDDSSRNGDTDDDIVQEHSDADMSCEQATEELLYDQEERYVEPVRSEHATSTSSPHNSKSGRKRGRPSMKILKVNIFDVNKRTRSNQMNKTENNNWSKSGKNVVDRMAKNTNETVPYTNKKNPSRCNTTGRARKNVSTYFRREGIDVSAKDGNLVEQKRKPCCISGRKVKRNMLEHLKIKHPYRCTKCHKEFKSKKGKANHMRLHVCTSAYYCQPCDRYFQCHYHLTKHVMGKQHKAMNTQVQQLETVAAVESILIDTTKADVGESLTSAKMELAEKDSSNMTDKSTDVCEEPGLSELDTAIPVPEFNTAPASGWNRQMVTARKTSADKQMPEPAFLESSSHATHNTDPASVQFENVGDCIQQQVSQDNLMTGISPEQLSLTWDLLQNCPATNLTVCQSPSPPCQMGEIPTYPLCTVQTDFRFLNTSCYTSAHPYLEQVGTETELGTGQQHSQSHKGQWTSQNQQEAGNIGTQMLPASPSMQSGTHPPCTNTLPHLPWLNCHSKEMHQESMSGLTKGQVKSPCTVNKTLVAFDPGNTSSAFTRSDFSDNQVEYPYTQGTASLIGDLEEISPSRWDYCSRDYMSSIEPADMGSLEETSSGTVENNSTASLQTDAMSTVANQNNRGTVSGEQSGGQDSQYEDMFIDATDYVQSVMTSSMVLNQTDQTSSLSSVCRIANTFSLADLRKT